jgi:ubiquitin carboxyl-terminal hydrolase 48
MISSTEISFHRSFLLISSVFLNTSRDIFSSKDVYMLIYVRKDVPSPGNANQPATTSQGSKHGGVMVDVDAGSVSPPPRAQEVVNSLNAAHDMACDAYAKRQASSTALMRPLLTMLLGRKKQRSALMSCARK